MRHLSHLLNDGTPIYVNLPYDHPVAVKAAEKADAADAAAKARAAAAADHAEQRSAPTGNDYNSGSSSSRNDQGNDSQRFSMPPPPLEPLQTPPELFRPAADVEGTHAQSPVKVGDDGGGGADGGDYLGESDDALSPPHLQALTPRSSRALRCPKKLPKRGIGPDPPEVEEEDDDLVGIHRGETLDTVQLSTVGEDQNFSFGKCFYDSNSFHFILKCGQIISGGYNSYQ